MNLRFETPFEQTANSSACGTVTVKGDDGGDTPSPTPDPTPPSDLPPIALGGAAVLALLVVALLVI